MTDRGKGKKRPAAASRFAGDRMTPEAAEVMVAQETVTPDKKITAAFNTSLGKWDQSHNLFYKLTTFSDDEFKRADLQMIAEFRQMQGKGLSRAKLTPDEITMLREIKASATEEVRKHPGLTQDVAETLVFAARTVGLDSGQYVQKLIDTDGNIRGLEASQLTKSGPSKFDVNSWLLMVKQHGGEHGLGYFADKIDAQPDGTGHMVVNVEDPRVLRQLVALRNNPRLSAIMGAHAIADDQKLAETGGTPPKVWYRGITYNSDPQVMENQKGLQALGFDIGHSNADGVNGPLTAASMREFMQMYNITDQQQGHDKLRDVVAEMKTVAGEYDFNGKKVPPKAPKPTKTRAGAQFNGAAAVPAVPEESVETPNTVKLSTKDAFALKLASEKSNVPFDTLLRIVIAERAFEQQQGSNRSPGLFHISDGQWLMTVAQHGEKYGLGDIVGQMNVTKDADGKVTNVSVPDPIIRQHILDLRKDPRVSALMGAERSKEYPIQLDIAESYLGMNETKDNAALRSFFRKSGITHNPSDPDNGAWCAVFVNSVMDSLGLAKTGSVAGARSFSNESYGSAVISESDMAKLKAAPAAKKGPLLDNLAASVKPGDLVMFKRTSAKDPTGAWSGHVAFVKEVYQENGVWKIKYLGGNQGGGAGLGGGSAQGGAVTISDAVPLENALTIRRPPVIPGLATALKLDAAAAAPQPRVTAPPVTAQPAAPRQ